MANQDKDEQRPILLPTSFKKVKGRINNWLGWFDLLFIIPLLLILLLPVFVHTDISRLAHLAPFLVIDFIAIILVIALILPILPNGRKGYQFVASVIAHMAGNKKYGSKALPIENAFPYSQIEDNCLVGKRTFAKVMKVKGIDIAIFSMDRQDQQVGQFARVFDQCQSPINIIKFERRKDYHAHVEALKATLNAEIKAFIIDNKAKIKNFEALKTQVDKDEITYGDFFEQVKEGLDEHLVLQFETKLENLSYNIKAIEDMNESVSYQPVYFFLLTNANKDNLERDFYEVMAKLSNMGHNPVEYEDAQLPAFVSSYFVKNNLKPSAKPSLEEALPKSITFKRNHYIEEVKVQGNDKVEKRYCRVVTLPTFPKWVYRGWLSQVLSLTEDGYIIKTKDYPIDKALTVVNKKLKLARENALSAKDDLGRQSAEREIESLEQTLADLGEGATLQQTNVFILFTAESQDELRRKLFNFKKQIRSFAGFKIDTMYFQQKLAYTAMLPSYNDVYSKKYFQSFPTYAIANGYPLTTDVFQDEGAPIIATTPEGMPVMIDFKVRDNDRVNSNTIVFGRSGKGKSFFTKKMIKDQLSQGIKFFLIDPESEYGLLAKNFHGTIINLGGRSRDYLNPLQYFGSKEDETEEYSTFINSTTSFLKAAAKLTENEAGEVPHLLSTLYKSFKINPVDAWKIPNDKWPTISDLYDLALEQGKKQTKADAWTANEVRQVAVKLQRLLQDPLKANLWNNKTNIVIKDVAITIFDVKDLLNLEDKNIIATQMSVALQFILKQVSANKDKYYAPIEKIQFEILELERELMVAKTEQASSKLEAKIKALKVEKADQLELWGRKWVHVLVDEAHLLFDRDNTQGVKFLYSMVKRIRKYNGMTTLITQNIADFTSDEEIIKQTKGIINNSQYVFSFGLAPQDIKDLDTLMKEHGGLSNAQRDFLAQAGKAQSLFITGQTRMIMQTFTTEEERSLIQAH